MLPSGLQPRKLHHRECSQRDGESEEEWLERLKTAAIEGDAAALDELYRIEQRRATGKPTSPFAHARTHTCIALHGTAQTHESAGGRADGRTDRRTDAGKEGKREGRELLALLRKKVAEAAEQEDEQRPGEDCGAHARAHVHACACTHAPDGFRVGPFFWRGVMVVALRAMAVRHSSRNDCHNVPVGSRPHWQFLAFTIQCAEYCRRIAVSRYCTPGMQLADQAVPRSEAAAGWVFMGLPRCQDCLGF